MDLIQHLTIEFYCPFRQLCIIEFANVNIQWKLGKHYYFHKNPTAHPQSIIELFFLSFGCYFVLRKFRLRVFHWNAIIYMLIC